MPAYIAVEVARRELEARLLLGLVAAERGHDVVLGKIPHSALLNGGLGDVALPPGVIHLKSAAAAPHIYARFEELRQHGHRFSVQDEEHGLTDADFGAWAARRFPVDALQHMDVIFAWGPTDARWLGARTASTEIVCVETGSPRMDLWRPEVIGSAGAVDEPSGLILVVSSTTPFVINPLWAQVHNRRLGKFGPGFDGDDDPAEFAMYERQADAYRYVAQVIRGVRRLAMEHPERRVVVRPHHFEQPDAWVAAVGPNFRNISVRPDAPARAWVNAADVVVHGGSTVGLEATVAQRSVVAFVPQEIMSDSFSNRFGERASDVGELSQHVRDALSAPSIHGRADDGLRDRIAALDGALAADRIVATWEELFEDELRRPLGQLNRRTALSDARRRIGSIRRRRGSVSRSTTGAKGPYAMEVQHKFPSLDVDQLRTDAERLANHLGRFQDVEIIQIGEREVLLRAAGR